MRTTIIPICEHCEQPVQPIGDRAVLHGTLTVALDSEHELTLGVEDDSACYHKRCLITVLAGSPKTGSMSAPTIGPSPVYVPVPESAPPLVSDEGPLELGRMVMLRDDVNLPNVAAFRGRAGKILRNSNMGADGQVSGPPLWVVEYPDGILQGPTEMWRRVR